SPMTLEASEFDTRIATLVRVSNELLEIRYKPGTVFITEDVAEVQSMRRTIMGSAPYATLTIIPEDTDFSMESMRTDHAGADRSESQIIATAIVAKSTLIERLTNVYLNFFPQLQRMLVTDNEAEARAWMEQQLKEIASTGS
ncbi:MAG TPA: hypothetical protein PLE78_09445, partial [Flavobacteriales bacterium]|nr:hypothetical protein [Flavobacteriales bacterium]HQW41417.1 hypothetical protein [Flavobacteriales bacterium]